MPNSTTIVAELPAQTLVVQISIRVADLPKASVVPAQDDKGRTQAQPDVVLTIPYGGSPARMVRARIKGRSFRRLMNELSLYPNPPEKLVLTGRLNAADEIEGAGFLRYTKDVCVADDRNLVA